MLESIEQLRKEADICTQMAGVEDKFETVWITKSALLKDIDAIEREVRNNYIELPKDMNGEYIRVGDELKGEKIGGGWCEPFEVARMSIDIGGWYVYRRGNCGHVPHLCRHHKPPTVEDVLLEACKAYHGLMTESMSDVAHDMPAPSEVIAKYAAKLQIREEK